MRIEGYSGVNQIYKTQNVSRVNAVSKAAYQPDSIQISSLGKDIQSARQAVLNTPDIREDKVEPIKAEINSGTYSVDNSDFASRLLEKYQEKYVF